VPGYAILVDGSRVARVSGDDEVRAWIAKYRDDHEEDDPGATHVQVLEKTFLSWLVGGKLIDRERFL
jgi:hypothetical protein